MCVCVCVFTTLLSRRKFPGWFVLLRTTALGSGMLSVEKADLSMLFKGGGAAQHGPCWPCADSHHSIRPPMQGHDYYPTLSHKGCLSHRSQVGVLPDSAAIHSLVIFAMNKNVFVE